MIDFGVYESEQLIADLAVFADVGTEPPQLRTEGQSVSIRFIRNGDASILSASGEAITEIIGEATFKHANFRALLASQHYGSLRDWAAKQTAYYKQSRDGKAFIEQVGRLNDGIERKTLEDVDIQLASSVQQGSVRILLLDGPAGIGKTQFIERLSASRAESYAITRRPLILHVQSRGRTLSFISDLMAFSLQKLRLETTFDQVPILAKHGLVLIAIDGFDELADPDGHDLAWTQVSELITALRGQGSIVLAGRETFIGRDRILKDVNSVRAGVDDLNVLTLLPPSKSDALNWLRKLGWSTEQAAMIEGYLEHGSLALRPFFLRTLADPTVAQRITRAEGSGIVAILMEAMTSREVTKFGEAVEAELSKIERIEFVTNFMCEIARDMADNTSVSVSNANLSWLVEIALPKPVSDNALRILKSRSQVMAFLANDDRANFRQFYHEKFYEYFLSLALIRSISAGELSKPLARNLFGSSLLETFGDIVVDLNETSAEKFLTTVLSLATVSPPIDRTPRNAAALAIASLAVADLVQPFILSELSIDEARFSGESKFAKLDGITISQFDCRGADLTALQITNSSIVTLIADDETLLPDNFPTPHRIVDVNNPARAIASPGEVVLWIAAHLSDPPVSEDRLIPEPLREHPAIVLLEKACRLRYYWLRKGDDRFASKILNNEWWPLVEDALAKSELLTIEVRPASGTDARFVHIRRSDDILRMDKSVEQVVNLYRILIEKLDG